MHNNPIKDLNSDLKLLVEISGDRSYVTRIWIVSTGFLYPREVSLRSTDTSQQLENSTVSLEERLLLNGLDCRNPSSVQSGLISETCQNTLQGVNTTDILRSKDTEILRYWDTEISGMLSCWSTEILRDWDTRDWDTKILRYWYLEIWVLHLLTKRIFCNELLRIGRDYIDRIRFVKTDTVRAKLEDKEAHIAQRFCTCSPGIKRLRSV